MIDLESKRKKYDRLIKVVVTLLIGLVFGPIALVAVGGLAGLVFAWVVSEAVICFTPFVAMKFANWRVALLKHEAAQNPIETLENQFMDKEQSVAKYREHLTAFYASIQAVHRDIEEHHDKFPDVPCKFEPQLGKMIRLLKNRQIKFKQLKHAQVKFKELIDQKRSEYKVAMSFAKMSNAAGAGEDYLAGLMKDTAVASVTTLLDSAFAEMESSLLDEEIEVHGTITVAAEPVQRRAIEGRVELPTLDLGDADGEELEPATSSREQEPRRRKSV